MSICAWPVTLLRGWILWGRFRILYINWKRISWIKKIMQVANIRCRGSKLGNSNLMKLLIRNKILIHSKNFCLTWTKSSFKEIWDLTKYYLTSWNNNSIVMSQPMTKAMSSRTKKRESKSKNCKKRYTSWATNKTTYQSKRTIWKTQFKKREWWCKK